MAKILSWVLRLSTILIMALPTAQARDFNEIKQQGKIVVATEGQFPPFNAMKDGKLVGFEIDLMELIAKRMELTIEWKTAEFDALLPGLAHNNWDLVIASHAITPERAATVAFGNTHYCSGGVVVTKNQLLRNASDLKGKSISVQAGTSYMENVQKIQGLKEAKGFPQDNEARLAMFSGQVDAWVTDRFAAAAALRANPGSGARSLILLFPERIAAAVAKGNDPLKAAYDKALATVMSNGSYNQLAKQYFNDLDVRCPLDPSEKR